MAINDFIGFASNGSANIMSQADYAAAAEQSSGVQPGMASSKLANKAWRQGANMAAVIGELIKNHGNDALDNGDLTTLYSALILATASPTLAGLMSPADKTKLDGLISTDATQSAAGYMSAADKTRLDSVILTNATQSADGYMSAADKTNLSALATFVSECASGDDVVWSGSNFTNTKLGISGLMAQNGYISFGPNFGNLIIQWGTYTSICSNTTNQAGLYEGITSYSYPISFKSLVFASSANVSVDVIGPSDEIASIRNATTDTFQLWVAASLLNATITATCIFIGI